MNANSPIDFNLGPGDHRYKVKPFSTGKLMILPMIGPAFDLGGPHGTF